MLSKPAQTLFPVTMPLQCKCHIQCPWCPPRSPKHPSLLILTQIIHPTRTEALRENRTCLFFQLHDILFRGSYPGPFGFHCYPLMTAPARLATDVWNSSPVEINSFLDQTAVQFQMWTFQIQVGFQSLRRLNYISSCGMWLERGWESYSSGQLWILLVCLT